MAGPLNGVRVLDVTSVLMGPFATQILGDLGAEILKVEPLRGDDTRFTGYARHRGMGSSFLNTNRNKKSIAVDLKSVAGRELVLRLASSCDAFVSNIRPNALTRLGLDYAGVSIANPSIVYVNLVGYGRNGRYANRPAYDDLIQAVSGVAMLNLRASGDAPRYVPLAMVDRIVGTSAVNAILAGLLHRHRAGVGQEIEVPMFETMTQFVLGDHLQGRSFVPPVGPAGYARLLSPNRRPFATSDGFVAVLPYNDAQWRRYFEAVGLAELAGDKRFSDMASRAANIDALYAIVGKVLLERTTAAWLEILDAADIPAMPLHTIDTILDDPHLRDVGFLRTMEHPTEGEILTIGVPTSWSATAPDPISPAPRLGQHTEEILAIAGLSSAEISDLIGSGIVRASDEIGDAAAGGT
ncbi:CoA transferase [Bradyrhizobium sp. LHD-71]|uniref:CaiB/BaiF CoA transferase family protein n=1 Tax=Bradyrhizobium sp. LHD-71 TaxID=3072141 RepID=UPI00280FD8D9|nr:CoA transferase [Bradyrhizobium sp. LHD-71]MDQ8731856.1 CoA transferase [Bradyrhizobium sp. LHD-71]